MIDDALGWIIVAAVLCGAAYFGGRNDARLEDVSACPMLQVPEALR